MKVCSVLILSCLSSLVWAAQTREDVTKRLERAAEVLSDIMKAPDKGIPKEILAKAKCVAVVPSMVKVAVGIGGEHGRGVATCRTESGWSPPVFFTISGGSYGLQFGAEGADLVLMAMNEKGMRDLLSSKFQIGGDASVAAGPVGRHVEAGTDVSFRSEILTYSRSRGVFAGISLKGATVRQDDDSTVAFYGKKVPYENILAGKVKAPPEARTFLAAVRNAEASTAAEKAK